VRKLDQINRAFVNAAHTQHHGGAWSWMQDVTNFQTKDGTTLNGALTTASNSVILTDASDFDSAGRLWIKTSKGAIDFVDYTSKASNTLSGATDIDMTHATAEKVGKLYALPTGFAKSRKLIVNNTTYDYLKQDLLPFYRTYDMRGAYIVMPEDIGEQDCTLYFERAPTDISSGVDATDLATTLDIPEDFMWYAIHSLMAHIYRIRRKRDDAMVSDQLAQMELTLALNYDINPTTPQGLLSDY
jgi:hypothetical protein